MIVWLVHTLCDLLYGGSTYRGDVQEKTSDVPGFRRSCQGIRNLSAPLSFCTWAHARTHTQTSPNTFPSTLESHIFVSKKS